MSRPFVPITDEFVDRLRDLGADADLIEFTERHVTRYSQADIDRAQNRTVVYVLVIEVVMAVVVAIVNGARP